MFVIVIFEFYNFVVVGVIFGQVDCCYGGFGVGVYYVYQVYFFEVFIDFVCYFYFDGCWSVEV